MTIVDVVHERGPLTVAAFMDLALNDPQLGYYARATRRSGRAGDFFTSVDVGPIFGELLAVQIAEMFDVLDRTAGLGSARQDSDRPDSDAVSPDPDSPAPDSPRLPEPRIPNPESRLDLVEAGAGNGQLSSDILRSLHARYPSMFGRVRLHLVETSPVARADQLRTLDDVAGRLASSADKLPASFDGVLLANELLDAFPVHQVVMTAGGLREVYVAARGGALTTFDGPLSTPELARYFDRLGIDLRPGWRAEVNLRALDWIRNAYRRLARGFVIAIDYGHEARDLYAPSHAAGTLTTFSRHRAAFPGDAPAAPAWLQDPGERDLTTHVDFTSVRAAADAAGFQTIALLDQTYFLIGLMSAAGVLAEGAATSASDLKRRLALKTLLMPGGLGSTHKVLILGKSVGRPALAGCSYRVRTT